MNAWTCGCAAGSEGNALLGDCRTAAGGTSPVQIPDGGGRKRLHERGAWFSTSAGTKGSLIALEHAIRPCTAICAADPIARAKCACRGPQPRVIYSYAKLSARKLHQLECRRGGRLKRIKKRALCCEPSCIPAAGRAANLDTHATFFRKGSRKGERRKRTLHAAVLGRKNGT